MARKTLLNESEIRRFMKLASISPLKEGYGEMPGKRDEENRPSEEDKMKNEAEEELDEMRRNKKPMKEAEEEETMDEGLFEQEEEDVVAVDMDAEEPAPMDIGDEPAIPEEPAPMAEPMGGMGEDKEKEFANIVDKLADLLGLDAEVEVGEEEEEGEVEGEEGGDLGPDSAPEDDEMRGDDEEDAMQVMGEEEEIVAEVARRVANRLLKEKKTEAMANKLAESIFRRLSSK